MAKVTLLPTTTPSLLTVTWVPAIVAADPPMKREMSPPTDTFLFALGSMTMEVLLILPVVADWDWALGTGIKKGRGSGIWVRADDAEFDDAGSYDIP